MSFSQPIFQIRGTQLKPYYSRGSSEYTTAKQASGSADAVVAALATSGVFGSSVIQFNTTRTALLYSGRANWVDNKAQAVLARIVPLWTGTPAATQYIINCGDPNQYFMTSTLLSISTAGKAVITMGDVRGNTVLNATSASALSFSNGVPTDIMIEWDGSSTAGSVKLYQNGVLLESFNPNAPLGTWNKDVLPVISFSNFAQAACLFHLNEFCVFNSTVGAYATRTDFVTSDELNGDTLPAVSDVLEDVVVGLGVGTLSPAVNTFQDKKLIARSGADVNTKALIVTQGDELLLAFTAMADKTTTMDLTLASLETKIKATSGYVTIDNSDHVIDPDQTEAGNRGKFTVLLSAVNSALLNAAEDKDVITKVTQGGYVTHLHGTDVLTVLEAPPVD